MVLPPFSSGQLERLARICGDSATGSELDRLLVEARLPPSGVSTKWRRLRDSFERVQVRDGGGNAVARCIKLALAPDRFFGAKESHEGLRAEANGVLSFSGLELRDDGRLVRVSAVRTLSEAEERADRLQAKLKARAVHPDVLAFCRAELVQENYFHAVLEAAKSVAERRGVP
ncbi:MAG: TIGR02391 family protein [Solirubrobacteraceae bacterium]